MIRRAPTYLGDWIGIIYIGKTAPNPVVYLDDQKPEMPPRSGNYELRNIGYVLPFGTTLDSKSINQCTKSDIISDIFL